MCVRIENRAAFVVVDDPIWREPEYPTYRVPVRITPDPETAGVLLASVPRLPGCVSDGATVAEALANIREALAGVLLEYTAGGGEIPWGEPQADATHVVVVELRP